MRVQDFATFLPSRDPAVAKEDASIILRRVVSQTAVFEKNAIPRERRNGQLNAGGGRLHQIGLPRFFADGASLSGDSSASSS